MCLEQRHRGSRECHCANLTSNINVEFISSPRRTLQYELKEDRVSENDMNRMNLRISPLNEVSQRSLFPKHIQLRSISKTPSKILDAPHLFDDFYLNLVDWSESCNVLAVGLQDSCYLWTPTGQSGSAVTKLCSLNQMEPNDENGELDMVCSVGWNRRHHYNSYTGGNHHFVDLLGVGTNLGAIHVYDGKVGKIHSTLDRHNHRVSVLSWRNSHEMVSGSRDRNILLRDIRKHHGDIVSSLFFHKQEVCGLKWNPFDRNYLASGGNDNRIAIWDIRNSLRPLFYGKHRAAIKALAWSPFQNGLLCSGGGTACRCIKFWDLHQGTEELLSPTKCIDTGSQVCNLMWSKNVDEIVSTHGYSLNQIVVWKYPSMDKLSVLTGHTYRVLYLTVSPDGQTIVTGAADQTLRMWNVFPKSEEDEYEEESRLTPIR